MWIMLTTKLPTEVSPPKMSLHYAYPHKPTDVEINRLLKTYFSSECGYRVNEHMKDQSSRDKAFKKIKKMDYLYDGRGNKVPNDTKAVWINYKNEKIKVWKHEYSIVPIDRFTLYTTKTHKLVSDSYVSEHFIDHTLRKGQRIVYDQALVDGCNEYEAMMVALGKDPTEYPPPIGWWRCRRAYAQVYCEDWELKE